MTHLPFTLLAYFFNALSVLANKFLLNKAIPDPLIYVFYISLFSLLILFALPFTLSPSPLTLFLASISTLLWTTGLYFMFKALKLGQVSRVIPIIGTLIPIILLIFAYQLVTQTQIWAVLLLILGMIALTLFDFQGKPTKEEVSFELLSAVTFALSYILLRQAYLNLDFFSVIVWSRIILIPFIFISYFLLKGKLSSNLRLHPKGVKLFLGGQIAGVLSEFLILYSISLANPALVNSLAGTQYVFLLILAREKYSLTNLVVKFVGIGLVGIGLYFLAYT